VKTRREFLLTGVAAFCLVAAPLASFAQQGKVRRIGFLYFGSRQSAAARYDAFLHGMREQGHIEGKSFTVEARYADGKAEILPELAAELIRGKVDVIVATGGPVYHVLHKTTTTIPIVGTVLTNPVGDGFAANLARPGGNITGLTNFSPELQLKQVELLRACFPKITRLGALVNPSNPGHPGQLKLVEPAVQKLGIRLLTMHADNPERIARSFGAMARDRAQAALIFGDAFFLQQMKQIADLALKHRLPSISLNLEYVEAGGLLTYGPNITDSFRRAAIFVDKIFKGTKPGDLPIEQPTKLELVVNMKTAKALGVTIPQPFLMRADRVIE
jgi:putative ABC transport system substrate-binding protein